MKKVDTTSEMKIGNLYNAADVKSRDGLQKLMADSPIPQEELLNNIGLYTDRRMLSRFLYINELYQQILSIHGSVFEFGVRYGQNIALLTSLRGIYEPYNHNRKIIGFDTWQGFAETDASKDTEMWQSGDFGVPENYEQHLETVMNVHEQMAPIAGIKKYELVKGDVSETLTQYLDKHPETILSMVYFDFDLYKPTKECLEKILPYLSKGAIIAFDEINVAEFPGETMALREVLGTNNFKIQHSMYRANAGYIVYE
ncbi:MAG: class I SAM-dependent methyltransferase [Bacteroidota bacterium]